MKTLICMMGLPRSGKSTIALQLANKLHAPILSKDCIRLALHGSRYITLAEPFIRAINIVMVRALFLAGHDVIVCDETHFSRYVRDSVKSKDWRTVFYEIKTPVEDCKKRAMATSQEDLMSVIDSMHARYEPLGDDEERYEDRDLD